MSNHRNDELYRYADIFRVLSNPHRLKIFMRLSCCAAEGDESPREDQICTCVGELGKDLGIAPSTVSHHLKELHQAGLVKMQRKGKSVECWVDCKVVEAISDYLHQRVSV
jgi:DNA-binding transcriptional ArsR family regulator